VILALFALVAAVWFVGGVLDRPGVVQAMAVPALLLGAATSGYTAYLFGQCEGRDLWQTPLLLPTLLAQAVVAGAAAFLIADLFVDVPDVGAVRWAMLAGIAVIALLAFAELTAKGTVHVEMAVAAMTRTKYAGRFWLVGVLVGLVVPAALLVIAEVVGDGEAALGALAALAAVAGLAGYEDAFVRAGQSVPLS
jgi:Ni/Fe-hydrogenase subunit HybB-like protein